MQHVGTIVEAVVYCLHLGRISARRKIVQSDSAAGGWKGRCGYSIAKVHCEPTNWFEILLVHLRQLCRVHFPWPSLFQSVPCQAKLCIYSSFRHQNVHHGILSQFIYYKFS